MLRMGQRKYSRLTQVEAVRWRHGYTELGGLDKNKKVASLAWREEEWEGMMVEEFE